MHRVGNAHESEQDFPKMEQLMDAFRRVLVNNNEVDTALPYFVGVHSLENHSINICLHVSGCLDEFGVLSIDGACSRASL
jgi:hypothetical protein